MRLGGDNGRLIPDRGSTILSMTNLLSHQSPVSRTHLRMTVILNKLITVPFPIVCSCTAFHLGKEILILSAATTPSCPKGILQFQHGTFEKTSNGSLILSPYGVDGRQLLSDPCGSPNTLYTRYVQKEIFKVRNWGGRMFRATANP